MSFIVRPSLLRAVGTAPALRAAPLIARRFLSTKEITELEELKLLNTQRMNRPRSPDLEIYRPQLTWILSGAHRLTGVILGAGFYSAALIYLLHPIYPAIDSAHLIEAVHNLPAWVKTTTKLAIAFPLTFHSLNGVRHLIWDTGKGLSMKGVYASGYAVLAGSVLSTLYLVFGV